MNIAIIGAGLSGANVYRLLKSQGHEVTVFEKSRGAGGRCATRYIEDKKIDHGTPFFEAKNERFLSFCHDLVHENILTKKEDSYYPVDGMNKICSFLLDKEDMVLQTRIIKADYVNNQWLLIDENNNNYEGFDKLILTIPAPQILQMDIVLDEDIKAQLESVQYDSIATLLVYAFTIENLDSPYLQNDIMFKKVVNNSKKYNYKNFNSYLLHLNPSLSNHHNFASKEAVKEYMINKIYTLTGENLEEDFHVVPHLWRYAFVSQRIYKEYLYDKNYGLGICGDFFKYKDLEGSFLSSTYLIDNHF